MVVSLTRLLSIFLYKIGQPRVIAEVLAGIILGPSVFGRLIPNYMETIFPKESLPGLSLVANLGLVFYMFLVGIEMNIDTTFKNLNKTSMIALTGIAIPMISGYIVSPYLYDNFMQGYNVNLITFKFFICVAISITAFPVLCRILNETNLLKTIVGTTTLGAAAIDDVTAWCLLALSISLINSNDSINALYIFLLVILYALIMLFIMRPLWYKVVTLYSKITLIPLTFIFIFLSSWITNSIGVHAIFGAFLFGLIMPRHTHFTLNVSEKIEELVQVVFLPLYFALSGLNTNIGEMTLNDIISFMIILTTAVLSKFVGCTVGALCTRLSIRESGAIGILMNTRGLVELIVLNVGLHAKIISEKLFTIMIIMALTTTMMTTPLLYLIYPSKFYRFIDIQSHEPTSLHFILNEYEEIPDIVLLVSLFNLSTHEKILISSLSQISSSTTDIVKATGNFIMKPSLDTIKMICTLMNLNVECNNIHGNQKTFVSEIVRYSNESNIDITIIPYKVDEYQFIKNVINMSDNKIMIRISGHNKPLLFVPNTFIEIIVIISDDTELLDIIKKFENIVHIRLTALVLRKTINISKKLRNIKWYNMIDKISVYTIIEFINQKHYDFVFVSYSQFTIDVNDFMFRHYKEIQILGTIGAYISINNIKPTLFILHSSTNYIETLHKIDLQTSIEHVDSLFLNFDEKKEETI